MNEIINNVLLAGDKFMSKQHLRQPVFTYKACGPFTQHHERFKKFKKKQVDLNYICKSKLDKACFSHNTEFADKNFSKKTISDNNFKDRAYEIAPNIQNNGYQRGSTSVVYKVFDKKAGLGLNISKVLPQELHRLLIKKFKRRKVYARLKVDIWGPELAENYCTLLTAPNIYSVEHMFSTNMLGLNL